MDIEKFVIILAIFTKNYANLQEWPCSKEAAIKAFREKILLNPFPAFSRNPYANQTTRSLAVINETLRDNRRVCGLLYNDPNRKTYSLRDFQSKEEAELSNYIVTHQGRCGVCSSTRDLSVYLAGNLTEPVRRCAMLNVVSKALSRACLKQLGFSKNCLEIWLYNSENTKKLCFGVCLKSWLKQEPFNKPDGSLNDCLQCDETNSGPVFKYFSGRTRRNSGIVSSIIRPDSQFL